MANLKNQLFFLFSCIYFIVFLSGTLLSQDLYTPSINFASANITTTDFEFANNINKIPSLLPLVQEGYLNTWQLTSSLDLNDYITTFFGTNLEGRAESQKELLSFRGQNKFINLYVSNTYVYNKNIAFLLNIAATSNSTFSYSDPVLIDLYSGLNITFAIPLAIMFHNVNLAMTPKISYQSIKYGLFTSEDLTEEGILPTIDDINNVMFGLLDLSLTKYFKEQNIIISITAENFINQKLYSTITSQPILSPSQKLSLYILKTTPNKHSILYSDIGLTIYKYINYTSIQSNILDYISFGGSITYKNAVKFLFGILFQNYTIGVNINYKFFNITIASYMIPFAEFVKGFDATTYPLSRRYTLEFSIPF